MRRLVPLLAMVAGCTEAPEGLWYQSTFDMRSRGIVLHEDGAAGHAGMMGTNCPFETERGAVTGDYDLPGEGEEVEDSGQSALGDRSVLLKLGSELYVLDKGTGTYQVAEISLPGVGEARLAERGILATRREAFSCELVTLDFAGEILAVEPVPCSDQLAIDQATGDAVVADGSTITLSTGAGTATHEWPADRALIRRGIVHTMVQGEDAVSALDLDGRLLWSTALGEPVRSMAHAGRSGLLLVVTERVDGRGEVVWLDAESGDEVTRVATPEPADEVIVSGDASLIGLVLETRTHFFRTAPELR